jgi:hypothetical protein
MQLILPTLPEAAAVLTQLMMVRQWLILLIPLEAAARAEVKQKIDFRELGVPLSGHPFSF